MNHEGSVLAVDGEAALFEGWPPSRDGLGFDESGISYSYAIFFTGDGRSREMITSDEAERIATEVIGPSTAGDGQGWHLEQFDSGWFIREDWMSEKSIRGGPFCVVERATGLVLAFPSSIPPTRIMTEYAQVVDRASQLSG